MRGNVVAVGVIISCGIREDCLACWLPIIMPLGLLIGGIDFKQFAVTLRNAQGDIPAVVILLRCFLSKRL